MCPAHGNSGETKPWSDSWKDFIPSLELWRWDGPAAALSHHRGVAFMGRACAGAVLTHGRGLSLLRNVGFCLWLTCDWLRAAMLEGSKN